MKLEERLYWSLCPALLSGPCEVDSGQDDDDSYKHDDNDCDDG